MSFIASAIRVITGKVTQCYNQDQPLFEIYEGNEEDIKKLAERDIVTKKLSD